MYNLTLEPLDLNDFESVYFLFETRSHPAVCACLFGKPPPDLETHKAWLTANVPSKRLMYVFRLDGVPVGYCHAYDFDQHNKTFEAGFVIHPDFQGLGYGSVLVEVFLAEMCEKFDTWKVLLRVKEDNYVALGLYHKQGFATVSLSEGIVTLEKVL